MPTFDPPTMPSGSTTVLMGGRFALVWFRVLNALVTSAGIQMVLAGTGDPNGVWAAPLGALYVNRNGGVGATLWVKESAPTLETGWVAK